MFTPVQCEPPIVTSDLAFNRKLIFCLYQKKIAEGVQGEGQGGSASSSNLSVSAPCMCTHERKAASGSHLALCRGCLLPGLPGRVRQRLHLLPQLTLPAAEATLHQGKLAAALRRLVLQQGQGLLQGALTRGGGRGSGTRLVGCGLKLQGPAPQLRHLGEGVRGSRGCYVSGD